MKNLASVLACLMFLIIQSELYSYPSESYARQEAIEQALRRATVVKELRQTVIKRTLSRMSIDYDIGYSTRGEQTFEVVDSQERTISKLKYPHRGQLHTISAEASLTPNFFVGGKFASSYLGTNLFKGVRSTDTDWDRDLSNLVMSESNSYTRARVSMFDINGYFRLFTLGHLSGLNDEQVDSLFYRKLMASQGVDSSESIASDRFSLDVFGGYQQYKGRYFMTDIIQTVDGYASVNDHYNGLASFYKIAYSGPRMGYRIEGILGKISTRFSFAYAWLSTKAHGFWNLRNYEFTQEGNGGNSVDMQLEALYALTPSFSFGLGFNYAEYNQKKLKESGNNNGSEYSDEDIIREANSRVYGPTVKCRYSW